MDANGTFSVDQILFRMRHLASQAWLFAYETGKAEIFLDMLIDAAHRAWAHVDGKGNLFRALIALHDALSQAAKRGYTSGYTTEQALVVMGAIDDCQILGHTIDPHDILKRLNRCGLKTARDWKKVWKADDKQLGTQTSA